MLQFFRVLKSGVIIAIALLALRATSALAAVTRTNDNISATSNAFYPFDPQNAALGVTSYNMTGANAPPVIQIIPDNDPSQGGQGLIAGNQVQVGEGTAGNRVLAQTFTPSTTFNLGAIAILAGGAGATFTDGNGVTQTMSYNIHIYQLQTGYSSSGTGSGGNPAWPGYIPNTSGPSGTAAADLLGGGSGLTVIPFGQPNSFFELNFTGSDQVQLQAGQHYAFEIAPNYALSAANPSVNPLFFQRESGAGWFSGNPYGPGDGYFFTQQQPNPNYDITTTRGNLGGSDRDLFMAIYAAPTVTTLLGDMNFDGHVDAKDIGALELALANTSTYLSTDFGNGTPSSHGVTSSNIGTYADVSGGGNFNNADIQSLINYLLAGHGSVTSVPEPATWVLLGLAGSAIFFARSRHRNRNS